MPASGGGPTGQDLQVVATAFEECARAFTTRGRSDRRAGRAAERRLRPAR